MALTDREIKSLKHQGKSKIREYVSDGRGLYLTISTTNHKSWIWKYRFQGKQKNLTIGTYPEVSLADARYLAQEARQTLNKGIDPSSQKKIINNDNNLDFKQMAEQWFNTHKPKWTPKYARQVIRRLETHVFPHIGKLNIATITAKDILTTMRKMESQDIGETTTKTLQHVRSVFDFAVIETHINSNPANRLANNLKPVKTSNLPALPQHQIQAFFKALMTTGACKTTKNALLLIMLTAVRMGSLRTAKWVDFDIENKLWNIPAENMKQNRPFTVTLSTWACDILHNLQSLHDNSEYVFPASKKGGGQHPFMSENTVGKLIFSMGFDGSQANKPKVVPHGFRSLFTDVCNEQGMNPDAIERALDHLEKNTTRRAYLRSDFMEERFKIAEWYSEWLRKYYMAAKQEVLNEIRATTEQAKYAELIFKERN